MLDLRASLWGPGCPLLRSQGGWKKGSLGLTLELGTLRRSHCGRPHHLHPLGSGPQGHGISFSAPELTDEAPSYLTAGAETPRLRQVLLLQKSLCTEGSMDVLGTCQGLRCNWSL